MQFKFGIPEIKHVEEIQIEGDTINLRDLEREIFGAGSIQSFFPV